MAHDRSTNHGFPLLQQGDEIDNWGNVVRTEAFVPLEERLMVVDTSANRSDYVSYADLLYYETDTGKLFEGDGEGSGWSETELESRISALEDGSVDDSGNVLGGSANGSDTVAVHPNATAENSAMAMGADSSATGSNAVAIGRFNDASGATAVAIGQQANATGDSSCAIGRGASATNAEEGVLGGTGTSEPSNWIVPGDFTVNGSKNFEISDPARPDTHDLRHGNYEGDVAGGLIYRHEVSITVDGGTGTATITMPDWFGPLATDVDVVVQAQGHFGDAYAERDEPTGEEITVTANASGDYKCIIFATRDDENVPDPEDHDVTKPKGRRWNGEPRAYYRDAPSIDPTNFDGVERVEEFFDHTEECDPTPCPTAFEKWRVTFDGGERVDVDEPLDAAAQTVVDSARDELEGN